MLRSHVTVQVALLREFALTDRAGELGLHAALVLLMPPERREEGVDAIAVGAGVLLLVLPLQRELPWYVHLAFLAAL